MDSKSDLRKRSKELRKSLNIEKISKEICAKIRELEEYNRASHIMIFYPMKYEIDLRDLLKDNKNFYFPKTKNNDILVCPYSEDLQKSEYGVMEPNTAPVDPNILDLVFVPALMVDKDGYRLGYGGGFYDRFLFKHPNIISVVPISKYFVTDKLVHDKYDCKVDFFINEKI